VNSRSAHHGAGPAATRSHRSPTRFLLIRHAASDIGHPPRLCGTFDAPFSREGRAQLRMLEIAVNPAVAPDALYTSPLRRARETAVVIGRRWGVVACEDAALKEIHCGQLEGLLLVDIQRSFPDLWARNQSQDDDAFRWPGGESYAEFRARVLGGLSRLAARHPGETVAVVTHSGLVSQVLGCLRGRLAAQWERDRPDPLSATTVLWDGARPQALLEFNSNGWFRSLPPRG
jgi:broad specificity phosphatase PhoE